MEAKPAPTELPRESTPRANAVAEAPRHSDRTAVLVVHGVGSQRPLDTLRGIVEATWTRDPGTAGAKPKHWIAFKKKSEDLDLPVVTTSEIVDPEKRPSNANRQVEFHEFYWAHVMAETRLVAVLLWLFEFVRKGPGGLAPSLGVLWLIATPFLAIVILSTVILSIDILLALLDLPEGDGIAWPWTIAAAVVALVMSWRGVLFLAALFVGLVGTAWLSRGDGSWPDALIGRAGDVDTQKIAIVVLTVFAALAIFVLTSVVGDAARYYRNSPGNIRVRREIRQIGIKLLATLHEGRHDRVIVVAHSLGSVIAYDILRAYWSVVCREFGNVAGIAEVVIQDDSLGAKATKQIGDEALVVEGLSAGERTVWRSRSRRLVDLLNSRRPSDQPLPLWLVTDFVTVGSPLAHARYLNAAGASTAARDRYFRQRLIDREVPLCPAVYSGRDGALTFTPPDGDRKTTRILHNAAIFGLTRWTNLFFPGRIFNGDLIGGPLKPVFGEGIEDIPLKTHGLKLTWHTEYWHWRAGPTPQPHLDALRKALDLTDADRRN